MDGYASVGGLLNTSPSPNAELRSSGGVWARLGERWDAFADRMITKHGWAPGGRTLDIARLERRLNFLTDRFKEEAPYWGFAIWLRQVGLVIAVSIPAAAR